MWKLFSQRNTLPPDKLHYDIPENVRSRILSVFKDHASEQHGGFATLIDDVGQVLFKRYGYLCRSSYDAARRSDHQVIEHFYCCDEPKALDFVEACFQQRTYNGKNSGVNEINEIFRETGIGYELTPFVEHHVEKETFLFSHKRQGTVIEYEYPRAIRRDRVLHHFPGQFS